MAKDQLLKLTCDWCKEHETFNLGKITEANVKAIQRWITVIRDDGSKDGIQNQYCRTGCEINAARQASDITLVEDKPVGPLVTV